MPRLLRVEIVALAAVILVGCQTQSAGPSSDQSGGEIAEEHSNDTGAARRVAIKAKDDLLKTLSGRLSEVVQNDGPVAAINVCKDEAIPLTKEVADRHGIRMGRVGVRLRNPTNKAPDWARASVESGTEKIFVAEIDGGGTGMLLPILLKAKCITCHGTADQIPEAIVAELDKHYPEDQARGFAVGELRGWVWAEVPDEGPATDERAGETDDDV